MTSNYALLTKAEFENQSPKEPLHRHHGCDGIIVD